MVPVIDLEEAIGAVLYGYAAQRVKCLVENNIKFVHYTTSDSALKIIRGSEIWFRNAAVMNDFSEIEHGWSCVSAALQTRDGDQLKRAVNIIFPKTWDQVEQNLKLSVETTLKHTYMISLGEHHADDTRGLLSMWRAYGGPVSGAALVLNSGFITQGMSKLPIYPSPVFYGHREDVAQQLAKLVGRVEQSVEHLRTLGPTVFAERVHRVILFAINSCKHPGFAEEREWRLIYMPRHGDSHPDMVAEPEAIAGIPQVIYKMPLRSSNQLGMLDLKSLLHRVIVGPTLYPSEVREAFCLALANYNAAFDPRIVALSDIPLRQRS